MVSNRKKRPKPQQAWPPTCRGGFCSAFSNEPRVCTTGARCLLFGYSRIIIRLCFEVVDNCTACRQGLLERLQQANCAGLLWRSTALPAHS